MDIPGVSALLRGQLEDVAMSDKVKNVLLSDHDLDMIYISGCICVADGAPEHKKHSAGLRAVYEAGKSVDVTASENGHD